MGFLDDAIREHLDLKRRHGADPTEVQQAEQEALGPVRRDRFEHGEDEPEAIVGPESAGAYDQAVEPGSTEGYEANGEAGHDWADAFDEPFDEHGAEAPPLHSGAEEPLPAAEPFSGEPFEEDPLSAEPLPDEGSIPPPHPADGQAGDETAEYNVEETFAAEQPHEPAPAQPAPSEGEEDVLEETPEFLQDAPEHDRLWFEQRPPRDFDFDG